MPAAHAALFTERALEAEHHASVVRTVLGTHTARPADATSEVTG